MFAADSAETVTVARGTGKPVMSRTVPLIVAVVCAYAVDAKTTMRI
jgi:hypothetical protein